MFTNCHVFPEPVLGLKVGLTMTEVWVITFPSKALDKKVGVTTDCTVVRDALSVLAADTAVTEVEIGVVEFRDVTGSEERVGP